jgi:uncharacterized protein YndB with AHSA1/START domain
MTTQDGTIQTHDDGTRVLRYERRLKHPIDRVWAAITEPDQIEAWLARAQVDLREGGSVSLEWLNTDENGERYDNSLATGTVTRLDPPRLVEYDTDVHGRLTWELRPEGDQTHLTFTAVIAEMPDDVAPKSLAGWHTHLDFLEEALDDGVRIDWPNWPRERWAAHNERYEAKLAANAR